MGLTGLDPVEVARSERSRKGWAKRDRRDHGIKARAAHAARRQALFAGPMDEALDRMRAEKVPLTVIAHRLGVSRDMLLRRMVDRNLIEPNARLRRWS